MLQTTIATVTCLLVGVLMAADSTEACWVGTRAIHSHISASHVQNITQPYTAYHTAPAMPGNSLDIGYGRPSQGKARASHGRRQPSASLYDAFDAEQIKQFKEAFTVSCPVCVQASLSADNMQWMAMIDDRPGW
jgi:hypothetical protein